MGRLRALLSPRSNFMDLSNPAAWLMNNGGFGRKTISGENISPATAMSLSAYYACIRNISEDVGKLPFLIYERQLGGGKSISKDHPLRSVLRRTPNRECTAMTFRELMTGWALGWGNAYAEIERDGNGDVVALWPIHPWRVHVRRIDGVVYYDVWSPEWTAGAAVRLDMSEVLHIRGFGDDPICGISMARVAAESIGVSLAAQTFGAAFFGNGAVAGVVLTHPGKLSPQAKQNLRESWHKVHGGPENAHKVSVLEEGIKIEKTIIPPNEAQFLETRNFQVDEIARWFRMPPHKIQQMARSTFNNIEQQSIEYVSDTLMPWLRRWEEECERKLLDERDADLYDIRHDVDELMRGDAVSRSNYYRTMISTGAMTPNEARRRESLNPVPAAVGDVLYMQGAMATLERIVAGTAGPASGQPGKEKDPGEQQEEDPAEPGSPRKIATAAAAEQLRPVFDDAEARCRRKEEMAIVNAVRKFKADTVAFDRWAATFYAEHNAYLVEAFAAPALALANAVASYRQDYRPDAAALDECLRNYCVNAQRHVMTTRTIFTPDQPLAQTVVAILTLEVSHA